MKTETSQPPEEKTGHCRVCSDPVPSGYELCPTCERCRAEGDRRRKEKARRDAFGVGNADEPQWRFTR
jgi:predicted nucleic acid-binding Zn ribbon protein